MHRLRTSRSLGLGLETVRAVANLGTALWLTDGPAQGLELEQTGIDLGRTARCHKHGHAGKGLFHVGAVRSWTLGRRRASRGRGDCVGQEARRQLPRSDGTRAQRRASVLCADTWTKPRRRERRRASASSNGSRTRKSSLRLVVAAIIEHERGNGDAVELAEEFAGVVPPASPRADAACPEVVRLSTAVGALDVAEIAL